jgi:hypothetical protein
MTETQQPNVVRDAPEDDTAELHPQDVTDIAPDGLNRSLIGTLNEISNYDLALEIHRDDEAVEALRPAGKRNKLGWRTRPVLNEAGLISNEQLHQLRDTYVVAKKSMDEDAWKERGQVAWQNSAARMLLSAAELNENVRDLALRNLDAYYRNAVEVLADSNVLADDTDFDILDGQLSVYDATEQQRKELQAWLDGKAPRRAAVMTGALAVRQTWRVAASFIGWPSRKLYSRFFVHDITPEDVGRARRIKNGVAIVALAFAGYGAYRAARGFYDGGQPLVLPPDVDTPDPSSLPSPTEGAVEPTPTPGTEQPGEPVEPQPTQPTEPTEPTEPTPEPETEWSRGAETVEDGEGWIHQLREMNVTYSPEFMEFIWDDVRHLGYTKENPDTGAIEYFLKERDKPIPTETLDLIEEKHRLFSAMQLAAIR